MPWSTLVRENRENILGVKFGHKLSCLEGFGGLLGLVTIPDIARNKEVDIRIDNSGFVGIYRKRHSSCPYAYTIAKAIYDVGRGLACRVSVSKTPRLSGKEDIIADALSEGDWEKAWPLMPHKNVDPDFIPVVLRKWIANLVPDMSLGGKILSEMSNYTKVLYLE